MNFTPTGFRRIDGQQGEIRSNDGMTLILIQSDGSARYARDRLGKDHIVRDYKPEDLLLMAWTGQWRTDIFLLDSSDLAAHYRKP